MLSISFIPVKFGSATLNAKPVIEPAKTAKLPDNVTLLKNAEELAGTLKDIKTAWSDCFQKNISILNKMNGMNSTRSVSKFNDFSQLMNKIFKGVTHEYWIEIPHGSKLAEWHAQHYPDFQEGRKYARLPLKDLSRLVLTHMGCYTKLPFPWYYKLMPKGDHADFSKIANVFFATIQKADNIKFRNTRHQESGGDVVKEAILQRNFSEPVIWSPSKSKSPKVFNTIALRFKISEKTLDMRLYDIEPVTAG